MARSISQIKSQMIDEKNNQSALSGLTSTSQTAIWNLYFFIVATAINIFEQLQDLYKSDIQTQIANAIPQTKQWLQSMVFNFQFDANNPQILSLVDLVPQYAIVDTTKQIVTRCSVNTEINKQVSIRVAKENPPVKLTTAEVNALSSYVTLIGNAGVTYNVISLDPDLIEINADIYYNAQYSAIISDSMTNAINTFLANIDFNGAIYVGKLEDAMRGVAGVNDVKINVLNVRASFETYAQTHTLYNLSTGINNRLYQPYAGYIITETQTSHTLTDTLTYHAQ
jgi:hypothetical protein